MRELGDTYVEGGKPVFQTHLSRLSCRWLGFPVCLRSAELLKLGQGLGVECLVRITLAQRQAHPSDTDPNLASYLQQFEANRLALRLRPLGPLQSDTPERVQQIVSHRGKPQAQLIALHAVRRGPIGKQLLLLLNPILRGGNSFWAGHRFAPSEVTTKRGLDPLPVYSALPTTRRS